jgi:hypothetical protein
MSQNNKERFTALLGQLIGDDSANLEPLTDEQAPAWRSPPWLNTPAHDCADGRKGNVCVLRDWPETKSAPAFQLRCCLCLTIWTEEDPDVIAKAWAANGAFQAIAWLGDFVGVDVDQLMLLAQVQAAMHQADTEPGEDSAN